MAARSEPEEITLHDQAPGRRRLLDDVLEGLQRWPRQLPCKYFYDERGARLFEQICELEEYYPTRTELGIMERAAAEMAARLGPSCLLVEYGSGAGTKTRILLEHLQDAVAYVPVDISREHLIETASAINREHPHLEVLPLCADFTQDLVLPQPSRPARRRAAYFPGSTIGNFEPPEAQRFLARTARLVGPGGAFLLGTDLVKDSETLERAYDDSEGVTAAFNLNLLRRLNRELGADFDLSAFRHRAVFDAQHNRIAMSLVSTVKQQVQVGGTCFDFEPGEEILTEFSHKYHLEDFTRLAARSGFAVDQVWTDDRQWFSVQLLVAA